MVKTSKLLAAAVALSAIAAAAPASAAVNGSFSLTSFSGSFVGGSQTAMTATGLDFGTAFGGTGNGYGTNGTALVGNGKGSFAGLNGTFASIADISLGALFANPYTTNPFISFGANSPITLSFTNAGYTRSPLGTSVTITGAATFSDGTSPGRLGTFSLSTSSQSGSPSDALFTFTSNASVSAPAVPEPATWGMMILGFGVVGAAMRRRKAKVTTNVSFA